MSPPNNDMLAETRREGCSMKTPKKQIKLLVIPKPAERTRTVLLQATAPPLFIGEEAEGPDYVCGKCDSVLIAKTTKLWLLNIVIRCFNCGAYNDTRDAFK
jgi:hypothetical protein